MENYGIKSFISIGVSALLCRLLFWNMLFDDFAEWPKEVSIGAYFLFVIFVYIGIMIISICISAAETLFDKPIIGLILGFLISGLLEYKFIMLVENNAGNIGADPNTFLLKMIPITIGIAVALTVRNIMFIIIGEKS